MKKTSKNSIKKPEKAPITYKDRLSFYSWAEKPVSIEFIEDVAEDLLNWATTNEDAIKITQFFVERGIDDSDFYNWKEKSIKLQRNHRMAMMAIGNRRELGALKKKYDPTTATFMLPHYDKNWKDMIEWRASLKTKEEDKSGPQFIVIEKMPDSNLVPHQEKTDESGDSNTSK